MSKPTHGEVSAFTGRSETSMDGALEDAARQAIANRFAPGTRFDVVRQQIVISNPQVTEYKVLIVPT